MSAPEPTPPHGTEPSDGSGTSGTSDPTIASGAPTASEAQTAAARRSVAVLGDRVLVAPPGDSERTSKGGILIPATARSMDRKGLWGETIGIGPHVRQLDVGDEVLYLPDDAIEVDVQGDAYLIVRERDVHAVASARRDGATGLYL